MNLYHSKIANSRPTFVINTSFKNELLALTLPVESKTTLPRMQAALGFLDLPNEILILIFELLEDDLYILARLSRRIHHLSLPIYLARKGMNPFTGELVLFDERSEEVLQALSIALFQPPLKCLHCTFNFHKPKSAILKDLRGLFWLVARLSILKEAHLDFMNFGYWGWGLRDPGQIPQEIEWAMEFRDLFDAIVDKGCATLTICLPGWCFASAPADISAAIWQQSRIIHLPKLLRNNILPGYITNIARHIVSTATSQAKGPVLKQCALDTFNLHSSMLFHVQFFPWTVKVLNHSGLSILSLKHLDIHPGAWAAILPRVTLPRLSNLSIDLCSVKDVDLLNFLFRHPQIQRLYLGRSLPTPSCKTQPSNDLLPNLAYLSATPDYLIHLLNQDNTLPNLIAVSVISRVNHGHYFDFGVMNNVLFPISRRLRQLELTLEISFESSSDDWMLLDTPPDVRPGAPLLCVSILRLKTGLYRLPINITMCLPLWLMLFPGLKHVSFDTPSQSGPTELTERRIFIISIYMRCPQLETIEINGLTRNLDGWLLEQLL